MNEARIGLQLTLAALAQPLTTYAREAVAGVAGLPADVVNEPIEHLTNAISAVLECEEHRSRLADLKHEANTVQDIAHQAVADKAETQKVLKLRTPGGLVLAPASDGEVLESAEFGKLSREEQMRLEGMVQSLQKE